MSKPKRTLIVVQEKHGEDIWYRIREARNTISHEIGSALKPPEVERLIEAGYNIIIRAPS